MSGANSLLFMAGACDVGKTEIWQFAACAHVPDLLSVLFDFEKYSILFNLSKNCGEEILITPDTTLSESKGMEDLLCPAVTVKTIILFGHLVQGLNTITESNSVQINTV